jgi:pSer/pThr/pTyr-binding forkhead associated (FHA) protein
MAKLILSMDNLVLKEIPLSKERTTLGRKASNDIQIDNLAISGEHAVIVTILNDSFLEDLNSTNGTFVNGQQVKKHFLQNNDVIELGKYRLKYINEAPQQASQADFEKTMVLRPDMLRKPADPVPGKPAETAAPLSMAPPASPPPAAAALLGVIQVLNGSNAGKTLELVKSLTTLGKPGVQVAVIARRPHGYFLTHVEGARFPTVNGTPIDTQARELHDHDVIELAGVKMEFFIKP